MSEAETQKTYTVQIRNRVDNIPVGGIHHNGEYHPRGDIFKATPSIINRTRRKLKFVHAEEQEEFEDNESEFDVANFLNTTSISGDPSAIVSAIEAGKADHRLDEVEEFEQEHYERAEVLEAIENRREYLVAQKMDDLDEQVEEMDKSDSE
jgi:hypothetical protein